MIEMEIQTLSSSVPKPASTDTTRAPFDGTGPGIQSTAGPSTGGQPRSTKRVVSMRSAGGRSNMYDCAKAWARETPLRKPRASAPSRMRNFCTPKTCQSACGARNLSIGMRNFCTLEICQTAPSRMRNVCTIDICQSAGGASLPEPDGYESAGRMRNALEQCIEYGSEQRR